ncbi:MAG: sugar transferase [Clostridia bacterium]|nr:sugar transferase [Clostridia bacterium]
MYKIFKRIIDITLSVIGLIFLFLPMILIALAIVLDSEGKILFKQKRLGKNQKIFTIYKFRTMIPNAYEIGGTNTYEGDPRITRVGNFLRKSSLDELPQLLNIIKGEMSIIGPRPILEEEFTDYKDISHYAERFSVLPGLFCTVDLDYRAQASREIQFEKDLEYCSSITLINDIKIFFGVLKTVLTGSNVYGDKPVNAEEQQEAVTINSDEE